MKDEVKIKGFRFQVYCYKNVVHIHSPEETEKLDMPTREFGKKFKPFLKGLKQLKEGQGLFIGIFRVDYHMGTHEDTFQISLGKEKVCVGKEHLIGKMDDFKRLVEKD